MKPARASLYLLAVALMLALALAAVTLGRGVRPQHLSKPLGKLSLGLGKWRAVGEDKRMDRRTLEVLNPQDYLLRSYLDPAGDLAAVFIAYFGRQEQGRMIHSPRHCLPGAGWQVLQRRKVTVPAPGGGGWQVNHLVIGRGLDKLSVLYWYQGRGRVMADELRDRLCLMLDGVLRKRTDGALVRITTRLDPEGRMLDKQIELASHLIPALERLMPQGKP